MGAGGPAASAAGLPVPCLFSNNCNEHEGKPCRKQLSSVEKKRAHAIAENVNHLVNFYGINRCGFLTLTFDKDLTWKEAGERFHSLRTGLLSDLFEEYICVLEFTKRGRPHFHLVVVCKEDIRSGFNFDHYEAVREWNRSKSGGPKPVGKLNQTAHLGELWATLRAKLEGYGFGRIHDLCPIKTTAEAIGRYVGGYLSKSLGNRLPEHKGARYVRYSRTCPRKYKGAFSWNTINGWIRREKTRIWANSIGCPSFEHLRVLLGRHWAYNHREIIERVDLSNLRHFPTERHLTQVLQIPTCEEVPQDCAVSYNAPLEENRFSPCYRCDVHGSSNSLSPSKGAPELQMQDESGRCGAGGVPSFARTEAALIGGASVGSGKESNPQPEPAFTNIHDSGNRPSRKYALNTGKDYPKFHRQPVML